MDGDKFIEDPVPVLQSVEKFLHIPSFFTDQHFTHNGKYILRAHWGLGDNITNLYTLRKERLPVF